MDKKVHLTLLPICPCDQAHAATHLTDPQSKNARRRRRKRRRKRRRRRGELAFMSFFLVKLNPMKSKTTRRLRMRKGMEGKGKKRRRRKREGEIEIHWA